MHKMSHQHIVISGNDAPIKLLFSKVIDIVQDCPTFYSICIRHGYIVIADCTTSTEQMTSTKVTQKREKATRRILMKFLQKELVLSVQLEDI